ncbi:MAG: transposase [Elusimicrobia bacterium]|nr:transposase [Elusimicrobiota bacterium]
MARPLRLEFPGAFYHVFARGNEKRTIFADAEDFSFFLQLLSLAHQRFGFILHAYVLMPNHYHLLLKTPQAALSRGIHLINGLYGQHFNQRHERVGHIFQGRFKALLVDSNAYWMTLSRYIHQNPVRTGLASQPWEYPWSSCPHFLGIRPAPEWLDINTTMRVFGTEPTKSREAFAQFTAARATDDPWGNAVGQTYWGSKEFVLKMKKVTASQLGEEHSRARLLRLRPEEPAILQAVASVFDKSDPVIPWRRGSFSGKVAALLLHERAGLRLAEIGARFGLRKHAVNKAITRFKETLRDDANLRNRVDEVYRLLEELEMSTVQT